MNGLSDHYAQILRSKNIYVTINKFPLKQRTRLINKEIIMNFQTTERETWESVNEDKDPTHMFNSFLFIFLNNFQSSFPVGYKSMKEKNDFITQGIKISCKHARSLYGFTKNSNDPKAKVHYIKYCKILRKVIKEAKKQHYNGLIPRSDNKIKTAWNIINKERGNVYSV